MAVADSKRKPNERVTLTRGKREVTVTERQARHLRQRGWAEKPAAKTESRSGSQS